MSKRPSPHFRSRSNGISPMPKPQLFDWRSVSPGACCIGKHKWIRYCYEAPLRVALEDAQQSAACVLEVHPEKAEAWGRWLSDAGALGRVQIRAKDDAAPGHCRLEIGRKHC